jgi:hypothetical protein
MMAQILKLKKKLRKKTCSYLEQMQMKLKILDTTIGLKFSLHMYFV